MPYGTRAYYDPNTLWYSFYPGDSWELFHLVQSSSMTVRAPGMTDETRSCAKQDDACIQRGLVSMACSPRNPRFEHMGKRTMDMHAHASLNRIHVRLQITSW